MKILMVVPPYRTTDALTAQLFPMPLGPLYVASMLRAQGHDCRLKDFLVPHQKHKCPPPACFAGKHAPPYIHYGMPMDDVMAWLEAYVPKFDAVGLAACQCNLWETAQAIAHKVKALGKPLVAGGPFVTTATEECFEKFGMDVAVQYEGEWVAEEAFARAIAGERGVILNGGDGKRDINELPMPDWSLAPPSRYPEYGGKRRGVLTISRGCPWTCEFCSVFTIMSRKHRRHPKERIKAELRNLWGHGVRYFCFLDDNLFISPKAADELLDAIAELDTEVPGFHRSKFYIEEGIEVRMAAQPGFIRRLAEHGRWENLALGLETANAAAAAAARKPYTADQLQDAVRECKQAGVTTKAFYIIGFPNDGLDSVAHDLVEFASFQMAARPNNLKLYPGTATTERFVKEGLVGSDYDWRLSTFYTPDTGRLSYKVIRKLKTVLGAIGTASGQFEINPFRDTLEHIQSSMAQAKYQLDYLEGGGVRLAGNMFRPTPYRVLAEIICARHSGARGATSTVGKNEVMAEPVRAPKDDIQAAVLAAMRGQTRVVAEADGFGLYQLQ